MTEVDPRDTSRTCPVCGEKDLRGRMRLECPSCGLSMDRQLLAAWNIAKRAQFLPGGLGRAEEGRALFGRLQSPRWGQGVMGAPGRPRAVPGANALGTQGEAQATA